MTLLSHQRKKEVIEQTLTFFIAVFLITTILHSFGLSWGVVTVPEWLSKLMIFICVIYACYKFSFSITQKAIAIILQKKAN
ncbi:hypothetical protein [Raoultella terrigena]|uniref:Uncharacterized protein n=1 Tax=Raoultella terrigena TaxID=577 RepID=A0AAQ0BPZ3_RAOTE|nr:hypothetical protein [Raoultella terrigena]MEB8193215.1 hypothetical protein [Raoultella terrigena]NWK87873.1 hypothetical protein [Raoultella terrigena]QPF11244.1 hypothetical protein IMO34_13190 [Raoultella terrigena]